MSELMCVFTGKCMSIGSASCRYCNYCYDIKVKEQSDAEKIMAMSDEEAVDMMDQIEFGNSSDSDEEPDRFDMIELNDKE